MIDFPNNVIEIFKDYLKGPNDEHEVIGRPLRINDPDNAIGIFATVWTPTETEIGQIEPVLGRYNLILQSMVKVATEEEGVAEHTALAKRIRIMLYRDPSLRVALKQTSVETHDMKERVQRYGLTQQRFLSNEVDGTHIYLSVTEVFIETELVPIG